MQLIMKKIVSLFLLCVVLPGCSIPVRDTLGIISGIVTDGDSNQPIEGVKVSIVPSGLSNYTWKDGGFLFDYLDIQEYTVSFSVSGYDSFSRSVMVEPGHTTNADVVLHKSENGMLISPGVIDFGENLTDVVLKLENTGTEPVRWKASVSSPWMSLDKESGEVDGTGYVSVSVSRSGLTAGTYDSTIEFNVNGHGYEVPVFMQVSDGPDYSEAVVGSALGNVEVNLTECTRKGKNVVLAFTLTNTGSYGNMGITLSNVNTVTEKTFISDNLGTQYPRRVVKIALDGKDLGTGNDIEGTLRPGIPAKCEITVNSVDSGATYMTYQIFASTACAGSAVYSGNIFLEKVRIH